MLEKKLSCTPSVAHEEPLGTIDIESGEHGLLTSGGERLSPSNRSSSSSNSHRSNLHYKSPPIDSNSNATTDYTDSNVYVVDGKSSGNNESGSTCGSVASSSGKRSKSKDSYHSSDEVIDEEDLLAISDSECVDNDNYPIIPGMITVANTSDVDSAFEDSHYSGSSDDKTRTGNGKHVIKSKSRRRSSRNSSGSNGRQRRYENIAEIATGNEEDSHGESLTNCNSSGGAQGRGKIRNKMECLRANVEHEEDFENGDAQKLISHDNYDPSPDCSANSMFLHQHEPTLFDLEVSPADEVSHFIMFFILYLLLILTFY